MSAANDNDRQEMERFVIYLRLVSQARASGVSGGEAALVIYPDVYEGVAERRVLGEEAKR